MNKITEFRKKHSASSDLKVIDFKNIIGDFTLFFQERMFDFKRFNNEYIKYFDTFYTNDFSDLFPGIFTTIEFEEEKIVKEIFQGQALLQDRTSGKLFLVNVESVPRRNPEDALGSNNTLTSSRDGFIESLSTNVALIRNRIKTPDLINESFTKGTLSKTSLSLLYIKDICNEGLVRKIKRELDNFDCDAIESIHTVISIFNKNLIFPTIAYTAKPDRAASALVQGRCILVMDNFPLVLIMPVSITNFLAFTDEQSMPKYYTYFTRFLSFLAVFVSIYSLGIITSFILHHQKNVSLVLLVAIRFNREGVPFTFAVETLMLIIIFELYIYAASRAPQILIQSVLVIVGGIIISQSLVSSSFASIISMVIVAFPFISSFIITNNVLLQYSFTIQRIFIFLLSVFFGLFGVLCGSIVLLTYAYNTRSVGYRFLSPIAPLNAKELGKFMNPRTSKQSRTTLTKPKIRLKKGV